MIAWTSKKQRVVISSTKYEYMAFLKATTQVIWL